MKTLFATLLGIICVNAVQGQNPNPQRVIDGEKQTTATAMDQVKKGQGVKTNKPDRSAGAGGSLTVENSKLKKPAKKRQIPDGSYGTNRTGRPFSENPNYPYDRNGNLIQNKNTEIIKGKAGTKNSPEMQGKPLEPNTKL